MFSNTLQSFGLFGDFWDHVVSVFLVVTGAFSISVVIVVVILCSGIICSIKTIGVVSGSAEVAKLFSSSVIVNVMDAGLQVVELLQVWM